MVPDASQGLAAMLLPVPPVGTTSLSPKRMHHKNTTPRTRLCRRMALLLPSTASTATCRCASWQQGSPLPGTWPARRCKV